MPFYKKGLHLAQQRTKRQLFVLKKHNFVFQQGAAELISFSPLHSNVMYIFYLIADVFSKAPFIKNDLFQLCPPGEKTTHRQEHCLAIEKGKKKGEILAYRFLIQVLSPRLPFSPLAADTNIAHGRLEMCVLCSSQRRLHKSTKQSFLFISLSLTGK